MIRAEADADVLVLPGLAARVRCDNPDFLSTVGVLFDLTSASTTDIEYSVAQDSDTLVLTCADCELYRGTSPDSALIALYGNLYERLVANSHYFLVHAGSAARDGAAVVMPGAQESGKSTLTAMLAANGWSVISDDVAAIDCADLVVHPYPRRLLIRPETINRNPITLRGIEPLRTLDAYGELVHIARPLNPQPARAVPVREIVFPRWADHTAVSPLSAGETAALLMDNSLNLRVLDYDGVRLATRLARNIRGFSLSVSDPSEAVELVRALHAP